MTPEKRLLHKVRRIRDHAATVAAMSQRVEKEIASATALGYPVDQNKVENKVRAIESRARQLLREIGIP